ncbi:hypothetical protein [Sphingomonas sp. dw_22]|uniref:hypothetical protein n=1 Tax=Sphingomonas sp. dw_22 TaxID=2721175 RepID=UPI001BD5358D|nr:hypothetical protein [Sphingomonas sp. dw_22]
MPQSADREYLERRHRQSLERARAASDPAIARVHENFAGRYAAALAREASEEAKG